MKKLLFFLIIGIFVTSLVSFSVVSDQFVDAGSRKKIHFTQTITSSEDPGQGHQNHQLSLILPPNKGTLYDGSMTFTSSEPVQVAVLHEIDSDDARGQSTWTVDGNTIYGLSLIDSEKKSGSFEFTGSALALHSTDSKKFTSTVSIDGWIRGLPIDIISQKTEFEKKEPTSLLSRVNIPVTIPMHKGIYNENQVLYIITDSSDKDYAQTITEKQNWNVEFSSIISDVPNDVLGKLFVFKNGVKGDGIFGFQNEVVSNTPSQESEYTALNSVIEVTWKKGQKEIIFESPEEIINAKESGRIKFNATGIVLNTHQIVWPDGQMKIISEEAVIDNISYNDGQIIEINEEDLVVTFVAHRGWGPDGRTIYYIVTDATPSGPAKMMGVVSSPKLSNLITHSSANDLFHFKNGIKGSGPLGFQPGIASTSLDEKNYSPIWKIYLVEWNNENSAKILETVSDIDSFRSDDLLSVSIARPMNNDHIVNFPLIDPFQ